MQCYPVFGSGWIRRAVMSAMHSLVVYREAASNFCTPDARRAPA